MKSYVPKTFGIATGEECELIKIRLRLEGMEVTALRNLRDFVVLFFSRKNEGKSGMMEMMEMDQMSAITEVIDEEIIKRRGEA